MVKGSYLVPLFTSATYDISLLPLELLFLVKPVKLIRTISAVDFDYAHAAFF